MLLLEFPEVILGRDFLEGRKESMFRRSCTLSQFSIKTLKSVLADWLAFLVTCLMFLSFGQFSQPSARVGSGSWFMQIIEVLYHFTARMC